MNSGTPFFVLEKLFTCTIVLVGMFMLSTRDFYDAAVVFGHAHFALTYFYQYRAGKIKKKHITPYILALSAAAVTAYSFPEYFILFVATFFLFHNFFDEFKLRGGQPRLEYTLVITLIISILAGWYFEAVYIHYDATYSIYGMAIISVLTLGIKAFKKTLSIPYKCPYFIYLMIMAGVLIVAEMTNNAFDYYDAFAFIILTHYMTWYVHLGADFKRRGNKVFNQYIKHVLIANFIFMVGYYVIVIAIEEEGILYEITYRRLAFFVWTLMHLITTFRLADYKNGFSFGAVRA